MDETEKTDKVSHTSQISVDSGFLDCSELKVVLSILFVYYKGHSLFSIFATNVESCKSFNISKVHIQTQFLMFIVFTSGQS